MKKILILVLMPWFAFSQMKKENLPLFKSKSIETFYSFLTSNAKFPKSEYSYSFLVNAVITEKGVMKDIVLDQNEDPNDEVINKTGAELLRVFKLSAKNLWKPSYKKGKPTLVYVYFQMHVYKGTVTGDELYTWEKKNTNAGYMQRTSGIVEKRIGTIDVKEYHADPDLVIEPRNDYNDAKQTDEEDNSLYNSAGVEVKPEYPGGIEKFYKYFQSNFKSPTTPDFPGGKIFIMFIIEKDGSLTNIKVKDIGFGTKEETLRVMSLMPKWLPGEYGGRKVRCSYMLPITLKAN